MEKTLIIDNKSVRFKSTGATPLRYKAQFHRDFLQDIIRIDRSINNKKKVKGNKQTLKDVDSINFEIIYNIVWVLAKTADPQIESPLTWYDKFEVFDIVDVFLELQDVISQSISGNSKKKMNMK